MILDTSVIVKWFIGEKDMEIALKIRDDYVVEKIDIQIPDLLIYERENVLKYKQFTSEEIKSVVQYKNRTGAYIDVDEDNIPDLVESLLSNNSPFVKFAKWALNPEHPHKDIWRVYNWTIVYFYSIRNQIKAWERDKPHNKSCWENATQWSRDVFNLLYSISSPHSCIDSISHRTYHTPHSGDRKRRGFSWFFDYGYSGFWLLYIF